MQPIDTKEKCIQKKTNVTDEMPDDKVPLKENFEASQALSLGGKAAEGQGVPSSQTGSRGPDESFVQPVYFSPDRKSVV